MEHYRPLLISFDEAEKLAAHLGENTPLGKAISAEQKKCDDYMKMDMEVPPSGEGGGYEHNRHKQNYIHMDMAARLFLITKDNKYQSFIRNMLLKYADVYLSLPLGVSKDTNPPGRLFHQTLNENMWMLYSAIAYSSIRHTLSADEQKIITEKLFKPMIDLFTIDYAHDFDIIHNHGLWAVAGVGICGYAIDDHDAIHKALYGLKGDGETGGFIAQLKQLFSPDGYYMEGPYYHRFAMRPIYLFAEVIERRQPEIGIYRIKDSIIKTTSYALMSTVFPNGVFPALNDASKTMGITDEGMRIAASICYDRYENNPNLLAMAQHQNQLWVHASSLQLSDDLQAAQKPLSFHWGSRVISDGALGDKGGVGILRHQKATDENMALLWYGGHGSDDKFHSALDHGHFDGLHLNFFNRGQEVLSDYGFGRWVNIEPKFGGRYIPENKSYCKQTIAHNCVTVDQKTQNKANTEIAKHRHGRLQFFIDTKKLHSISAFIDDYYDGVKMQRSVLLMDLDGFEESLLIDVFRIQSDKEHVYDYPLHYHGQIIQTDFDYEINNPVYPLGEDAGYQHLWKIAQGQPNAHSHLISWLQNHSYYSLISTANEGAEVIFARVGANDPDCNLRSEPALILRQKAKDHLFVNILETHGYFNESIEASVGARGKIKSVSIIGYNDQASVISFTEVNGKQHVIGICNHENIKDDQIMKVEFDGKLYHWIGATGYIK